MAQGIPFRIEVSANLQGISDITRGLGEGFEYLAETKAAIRKFAYLAMARATQNVSGGVVTYKGGNFTINRRTGKLARSFRVLFPNALGAIIINEANYASYLNDGTRAHDMKPHLIGKTVPLRVGKLGGGVKRQLKSSTGRKGRSEYISFRKVTSSSKGWIIPAQEARPFMDEAGVYIEPLFAAGMEAVLVRYLNKLGGA